MKKSLIKLECWRYVFNALCVDFYENRIVQFDQNSYTIICLFIHPAICPFIHPSIYLFSINLFIQSFVSQFLLGIYKIPSPLINAGHRHMNKLMLEEATFFTGYTHKENWTSKAIDVKSTGRGGVGMWSRICTWWFIMQMSRILWGLPTTDPAPSMYTISSACPLFVKTKTKTKKLSSWDTCPESQ